MKSGIAFLLCLTVTHVTCIVSSYFYIYRGYRMAGGTALLTITLPTMTPQLCVLQCNLGCGSATYSAKDKTCATFIDKVYSSAVTWVQDSDGMIFYRNETIQHNNWTMIFRAQSYSNLSWYDLWITNGYHDDNPLSSGFPAGCYRLDNQGECKRHFRSSILDDWTKIDQVKVSLYTNGSQVAYMIFNGSNSARESWYSKSSLLESSWTLLKTDSNALYFDFTGFVTFNSIRRMAICGAYQGCSYDTTYFLAIDRPYEDCAIPWSLSVTSYPLFVYSPLNRLAQLSASPSEYKLADVMAIFVKFSA